MASSCTSRALEAVSAHFSGCTTGYDTRLCTSSVRCSSEPVVALVILMLRRSRQGRNCRPAEPRCHGGSSGGGANMCPVQLLTHACCMKTTPAFIPWMTASSPCSTKEASTVMHTSKRLSAGTHESSNSACAQGDWPRNKPHACQWRSTAKVCPDAHGSIVLETAACCSHSGRWLTCAAQDKRSWLQCCSCAEKGRHCKQDNLILRYALGHLQLSLP